MSTSELAQIPEGAGSNLATLNMQQIFWLGEQMTQAGMFGELKNAAQAAAKIMAGQALGIDPVSSLRGIYIVGGNFSFRADLMAGRVKKNPKYDYQVIVWTNDTCILTFYEIVSGKKVKLGDSEFTVADAKRQGTRNMEKFPKNMLFARAMSNGVSAYCPDVKMGMPIEGDEVIEAELVEEDMPTAEETAARLEAEKQARIDHASKAGKRVGVKNEQPAEAVEGEVVQEPENQTTEPTADFIPPSANDKRRIMAQLGELGFKSDDEKHAVYTGLTGHTSFKELSADETPELIEQLQITIDNGEAEAMREMFIS